MREHGEPVKFRAPARVLSLLAYLIVYRASPIPRESLAFTLWPDELESNARSNLRRHLFTLSNDVLPPIVDQVLWILADKRSLQWNCAADYYCDLVAYQEAEPSFVELISTVTWYRGNLLEGFEDEWLQKPRQELQDLQSSRLQTIISAYCRQSEWAQAVPYAKMRLELDPWSEESVRTLMSLFLKSGDRTKALQIYRDFARRLYEELSVAPMPETTALYTSIHEQKESSAPVVHQPDGMPSLNVPASTVLTNAEAVRGVPSFTGREIELARIAQVLDTSEAPILIHGLGGVGKSALVREFAGLHRDEFHIIWWLQAQNESEIIDGFIRLGRHIQPGLEQNLDRRIAAQYVMHCLERIPQPILLLFDNIDDPLLLRRWAPSGAVKILATSREATWGSSMKVITLQTWNSEESLTFLQREMYETAPEEQQRQLAEQLGYLPLALAHAAAYLNSTRTVTLSRYLERLNDHLARAPRGTEYPRAVFATFSEAILTAESQTPGAAAMLCLAAHFAPDHIPESLFGRSSVFAARKLHPQLDIPTLELADALQDPLRVDEALGTLHRLSLLTFAAETRTYTMHRLVQHVGRQLVTQQSLDWALAATAAVHDVFPASEFSTWPMAETLISHARAVLAHIPETTPNAVAGHLARVCSSYLRRRAEFQAAEPLARQGLALSHHADDALEALANLENLAGLLRETNRVPDAEPLYREAIATLQTLELPPSQANRRRCSLTNGLGIVLHYSSRFREATQHFQQALALAEDMFPPDDPQLAIALSNLGLIFQEVDEQHSARECLERALAIDEKAYGCDHPDVATDLCNLAWHSLESQALDEAEYFLQRALKIREATYGTLHPNYAYALDDFAVLLHARQCYTEAETHHRQALAICQACFSLMHPINAALLNALAQTLHQTGQWTEAEQCYLQALEIDRNGVGPSHPNFARTLNNYAGLLQSLGRQTEKSTLLQQAEKSLLQCYGPSHPRTQIIQQNITRSPDDQVWSYLRRSPSRGLRE